MDTSVIFRTQCIVCGGSNHVLCGELYTGYGETQSANKIVHILEHKASDMSTSQNGTESSALQGAADCTTKSMQWQTRSARFPRTKTKLFLLVCGVSAASPGLVAKRRF